ncbi:MAG: transposase [Actinomycetota bacterium]|nr:transposase [Actinomycetota bacterium]
MPPSVWDWLPEDHLVWFVLDVVAMMDLSAFHAKHPNDGVGRSAYDPEMMLALLIYAYYTGTRSSRRIASACRTDLAMKVIVCDVVPEHDAIGRFRADRERAIVDVFVAVLMLCARAGRAPRAGPRRTHAGRATEHRPTSPRRRPGPRPRPRCSSGSRQENRCAGPRLPSPRRPRPRRTPPGRLNRRPMSQTPSRGS